MTIPTRRDLLHRCAALGALTIAGSSLSIIDAAEAFAGQEKTPTPWNEIGPFYKKGAPHVAQLRAAGDLGLPLSVNGRVFNARGEALQGASVEIWQANHQGLYDLDNYRYRAALIADRDGKYAFDSVMPGHYPARVCQHIHYVVTAPGHKPLITQLYFATDPVFDGNPDKNFSKDPLVLSRELVRPVTLSGDPKAVNANVTFELVLEQS